MGAVLDAGRLSERLEVLELRETESGTWAWEAVRKTWGQVELDTGQKKNLFSSVGIGARNASLVLRRQELTLHNALRWKGQHLFLTAIIPRGRGHLDITAAAVDILPCQADMHQGGGIKFPGVLTEKYLKHEQLEPYAVNLLTYVLVTPKPIVLRRGGLVSVDGINYEVQTAHNLDLYKNEYEIFRKDDL